jgi:hypothetical protein
MTVAIVATQQAADRVWREGVMIVAIRHGRQMDARNPN